MASPRVQRRSQLLVHRGVQGWLLLRIVVYVGCAVLFVTASLLVWQLAVRGPARWNHNHLRDIWNQYAPVFVSVAVLVPLFVYDMLRFSNRFMGPLYRLHRSLEALGRGEEVRPIRFREDDLLHEMADAFNQVLRRVQQQESESARPSCAAEQQEPGTAASDPEDRADPVAPAVSGEAVAS